MAFEESESGDFTPKAAAGKITSSFVDSEGKTHIEAVVRGNMTESDIREVTDGAMTVDSFEEITPEEAQERISGQNRRRVVGFSRWNASWQPAGPKGNPENN